MRVTDVAMLAFVTALGGHLFVGERRKDRFLAGLAVIGPGLLLVSRDK